MQGSFPYIADLEIERIFCLWRKKQKLEKQRRKVCETSSKMAGGEETKEGLFGILLSQESKALA